MLGPVKPKLTGAHTVYRNAAGDVVPSVTTIIGACVAKPQLVAWANRLGREGKSAERTKRDAANVGTIAHARIQALLQDRPFDSRGLTPAQLEASAHSVRRFERWFEQLRESDPLMQYDRVECETSLVSERLQCGGTLDIVVADDWLVDVKTSTRLYPEHAIQVAAYAAMFREVRGVRLTSVCIVRVGKEEKDKVDVWELTSDQLRAGQRAFRGARALYRELEFLKAAA